MSTSVVSSSWSRVGDIPPRALTDARLQLHHAAQIAVSAAISYIPAKSDDSHTALTWNATIRALTTEPVTAGRNFRIALRVEDLTLHAIDGSARITHSFVLPGRTIVEGHAWLREVAAEAGLDPEQLTARKHYTIPTHPVANGAPFALGFGTELVELARYWMNAAALLEETFGATPAASPVRTWPHHFDIATLIAVPDAPGAAHRTIGVGQSPGDDSYAEPYWYVSPSPYPATHDLPPLNGGGHWHTAGWVGAALPASAYVEAADQRAQVAAFVESAVAACRRLLGG